MSGKSKNIKANTTVKTYKPKKDKTWDSGLVIVDKPQITLDHELLMLCNEIQDKFPGTEFSILCKGEYNDEGFYVSKEYVIPKQKVTSSTVDYEPLDSYRQQGYNVVIHSHHGLGTFFSKTDRDFINCQFPCSVLYTHDGFTLATMSFLKDDSVFMIETDDLCTVTDEIEVVGIENITKKTYKLNTGVYKYDKQSNINIKNNKFEKPKKLNKTVDNLIENETLNALALMEKESIWNEEDQELYQEKTEGTDCIDCYFSGKDSCLDCYGGYHDYENEEETVIVNLEQNGCGLCRETERECFGCPNNY